MNRYTAAVVVALALVGCSAETKPYKTAPVAGVVTLDGQPLNGAHVTFMPEAQATRQSGPEAAGETDSSGRYSLNTVFGDTGASVGRNRVMISTRKTEPDPTNPDRSKQIAPERIPNKYFTDQSPLTIEVPLTGTNAANFELTTK